MLKGGKQKSNKQKVFRSLSIRSGTKWLKNGKSENETKSPGQPHLTQVSNVGRLVHVVQSH